MSNFPIHHGITLAPNAYIENLQLEILTSDPIPVAAGRIWFNSTEKSVKYSTLSSTGEVITVSNIVSSDVATALQNAKDYTDTSISALVGSAPEILNTLKELSDAIAGDDNFSATVLTNIANAKAEILGEVGTAFDTLGEIETKLTQLDAADTVPGSVDFKVKTEQDRAEAAELDLSGRVSVFEGTGAGSVTSLIADETANRVADAATEQAVREAAELDLSNQIAANELARTDAAAAVEAARVAEAAAVEAARVAEKAAVESTRAGLADAVEAARVAEKAAVESTRAGLADAVESTRAGLASTVESARVAEKAAVESARVAEAAAIESTRAGLASTIAAATATEHSDRVAAELGLTNAIAANEATRVSEAATEQATRVAAELGLTNAIAANEATRVSEAATEQAARVAAEGLLDTRVTTVEGQVNGKIGSLSGLTTDDKSTIVAAINEVDAQRNATAAALVSEASTARAAELVLQGNIDAEAITRASQDAAETLARTTAAATEQAVREAAELVLSNRINTEVSDRQAAITAEASARTTADTAIRTAINNSKYFHQTATTAVEHTIVHGLDSLQTSFVVLVERSNGKYRNDIVSVEEVDSNTLKVYLSEAAKIKISVNRYETI